MASFNSLPIVATNKYILDDYSAADSVLSLRTRTNVLIYKDGEDALVKQRPGFGYGPYAGNATVSHVIVGGYYWKATSRFYYVAYVSSGAKYVLYSRELGTNTLTITTIQDPVTFSTGATKPGWAEWEYGGTSYLLLFTGNQGWYITTLDVATEITDADMPDPHVPTPVVMDGYVFLAKEGTNDIYNSDLGSVTAWTSTAFISTEIEPGDIKALAKQKQHIVAFTDKNIEFFRNAAIPAPNSPLARVEAYNQKLALLNYTLLTQWEDDLYFVGTNKENLKTDVFKLSNFKVEDIGDESIQIYLKNFGTTNVYVVASYVTDGYFTPNILSDTITTSHLCMLTVKGEVLLILLPLACDIDTTSVTSPVPAAIFIDSVNQWVYWSSPNPDETSTTDENLTNTILSCGSLSYQSSKGTNSGALIAKIIYNSSTIDPLIAVNPNLGVDTTNGTYLPITSYIKLGPYDMDTDNYKFVHKLWPKWKIQPLDQTTYTGTLTVIGHDDNQVTQTPVVTQSLNLTKDVFFTRLGKYKNMYLTLKLQSNATAGTNSFMGELKGLGAQVTPGTRV